MKATLMQKIEAAKSLHDYDHAFVSAEGVRRFAEIFECKALVPQKYRANPGDIKGLTLADGAKQAQGMCAAAMAADICSELDVAYVGKFGRGSQLHECANQLTKHFERLYQEHFAAHT